MTISEVITNNWAELKDMCRRTNIVVSCHKTSEDIFEDVMVMALNKYKKNDISEEEGMSYLRKSLCMEFHFQWNKIDNTEVFLDEVKCPPTDSLLFQ